MKYLLIYIIVAGELFSGCHKKLKPDPVLKVAAGLPPCIEAVINKNKNDKDWETGSIEEYRFQGKIVYAFKPDLNIIADAATMIQANDCKPLCYVGGFRGQSASLCNGGNFFEDATLLRKIWTKPE